MGQFPGLGTVLVHGDGRVDVEVEPDDGDDREDPALREAALRHGWGEPLSLVRLGFRCVGGIGLVDADGAGCLVITGTPRDTAIVMLELVSDGWKVIGDRLVPITCDTTGFVAHPRSSPVLVSREWAQRYQFDTAPVRANSDAVAIDVPRATEPTRILAFVAVGSGRPDEPAFTELSGHERFKAASLALVGGLMAGTDDADERQVMKMHVALAGLPHAKLRMQSDALELDVAQLSRWWAETVTDVSTRS